MAEVRSSAGVPAASAFEGIGAPSPGTPLVVDTTQGDLYTLIAGAVVKSASAGTTAALLYGAGAPGAGLGSNGNYYFRSDGGVATHIYFKSGGAWAGII